MNFEGTPAAFYWWMFSLFWKATGRGGEGVEFVGPGSSQLVDVTRRFYWSLVNFSHFHWSSWDGAFGPVLHSWWKPFLHTLHLIGMVLESTASKHLAYFSLKLLTSARKCFNSRVCLMGRVSCVQEKCQVELMNAHLLLVKNVNDSAKFE